MCFFVYLAIVAGRAFASISRDGCVLGPCPERQTILDDPYGSIDRPLLSRCEKHLAKENVMTDTTSIPLNKLVLWSGNVRKTAGADTTLAELAASIAAHGLLQSLVVRNGKKGKFAVVAGGRRLMALQQLAESGRIKADYAVPCQVVADDADATEISLAENAVRENMHPADEFEAF